MMLCVIGDGGAGMVELVGGAVDSAASEASDTGGGARCVGAAATAGWVTPASSGNCAEVPVFCAHGKLKVLVEGGARVGCGSRLDPGLPCNANHPCMSVSIVVDACAATDDVPKILNIDVDGGVGTTVVAGVVAGVSAAGWVTPASSDGCAGGVVIGV